MEETASPPARGKGERGRGVRGLLRLCFPDARAVALALLTCVLLPAALIAVHVHENPHLSQQDEQAEYDYVDRMAQLSIPREGQAVLPSTLRLIACQLVATPARLTFPPCTAASLEPAQFGAAGYQYEAQQPPLYYAVTAALRWIPQQLTGVSELSDTRLTGALWLGAGLILLWVAGRLLAVEVVPLGIGILLLGTSPDALYQGSYVDNSAAAVFAGSLVALLSVLAWKRPGRGTLAALGVGAFAVCALDVTNALSLIALAVLFLGLALAQRRDGAGDLGRRAALALRSRWTARAVTLLAGGAISVVGWYVAYRMLRIAPLAQRPSLGLLDEFGKPPVSLSAYQALQLLQPLGTAVEPAYRATLAGGIAGSALSQNLQPVMSALLGLLLVAGGLSGLFVRDRRWSHWAGMAALPVLYVGGFAIGELSWLVLGTYPGLTPRYGLSVAPLLVLALVGSLRGRGALAAVGTFAVLNAGLGFYFLLG